jgi:ribonucleoside-diphosphate reductase alpha chain
MTNISVILDDAFFAAYYDSKHKQHSLAHSVYWATVRHMLETAEPGFSIDVRRQRGRAPAQRLHRDHEPRRLRHLQPGLDQHGPDHLAGGDARGRRGRHAFLLAGTVYSEVPYEKVAADPQKNRRLGLGLMGLHEWLLIHGKKYGPDAELAKYLDIYATSTEIAWRYADAWGISRPIKTRAIAPTGTIGIVAETTTGIEPIFCVAYKRRYLKGTRLELPVRRRSDREAPDRRGRRARADRGRLLAGGGRRAPRGVPGVAPGLGGPLHLLDRQPAGLGHRVQQRGRVQSFGEMLIKYLPKMRGMTCYPDGARGGQPLTPVKYQTAMKHLGEVFVEARTSATSRKGGSCGA